MPEPTDQGWSLDLYLDMVTDLWHSYVFYLEFEGAKNMYVL